MIDHLDKEYHKSMTTINEYIMIKMYYTLLNQVSHKFEQIYQIDKIDAIGRQIINLLKNYIY